MYLKNPGGCPILFAFFAKEWGLSLVGNDATLPLPELQPRKSLP
jgi:hypothetical protein